MNLEDLRSSLAALPPPNSPNYPIHLNKIVMASDSAEVVRLLEALLNSPEEGVETADAAGAADVAFAAWYGLLNHARRSLDYSRYENLFTLHRSRFRDSYPTYVQLFESMVLRHQIQLGKGSEHSGERCIWLARAALENQSHATRDGANQYGFQAHYASMVAYVLTAYPNIAGRDAYLKEAIDAVDAAIGSNPTYAKYHATQAELKRLSGNLAEARTAIAEAIDVEDSTQSDYLVRIMGYEATQLRIEFDERVAELQSETSRFQALAESVQNDLKQLGDTTKEDIGRSETRSKQELVELRGNLVNLIALLAAAIALIVTGTSLTQSQPPKTASTMLVIAGAVIVVAFGSFSLMQSSWRPGRQLLAALLAIVVATALLGGLLALIQHLF